MAMSRCNFYVEKLRHKNKIQSELRSYAQKPKNYVTNCHYELFNSSTVRIRLAMNEQRRFPPVDRYQFADVFGALQK